MAIPVLLCLSILCGRQVLPDPPKRGATLARIGELLRDKAFVYDVDFSNWSQFIYQFKKQIDSARSQEQFVTAVNDALAKYGVSHIGFMPPGKGLEGEIDGFGFSLSMVNQRIVVTAVFSGTEAERAGLHRGTIIEGWNQPNPHTLALRFLDDSHRVHFSAIHQEKFVPKLLPELISLDSSASVLQVMSFQSGYDPQQVGRFMAGLAGVPYLIVDLRGNMGGNPLFANDLLNYLHPPNTTYGAAITKDVIQKIAPKVATSASDRARLVSEAPSPLSMTSKYRSNRYRGHMAVLIDSDTASAGEIAAQALRDYAGAKVFGKPSQGMVLGMNWEKLPGDYTLYYPWRDYWTAKGGRIEGKPIVPDYCVTPGSDEAGPDPLPLRFRALQSLREMYPLNRLPGPAPTKGANSEILASRSSGLAKSAWARAHGNASGTGQAIASGPNGRKKWAFYAGGNVSSSPVIGIDGTIFVGTQKHNVHALDPAKGHEIWSFTTGGNVNSSPAIGANGLVYVGSDDSYVYALDAKTGKKAWSFLSGGPVGSSPVIGETGLVYVGSYDGKVYALDGVTGSMKWASSTEGPVYSSPVVSSRGTVLVTSADSHLYALDGMSGTRIWTFKTDSPANDPTLGPDGTVFVGSDDGRIYALSGENGTKIWSFLTDGAVQSLSISARGGLYTGTQKGTVYALDGLTGTMTWSCKATGEINTTIAIGSDGTLYVGSCDGCLLALDDATGAKKWSRVFGSFYYSSPAIGLDGTLYIGSLDWNVYAIK